MRRILCLLMLPLLLCLASCRSGKSRDALLAADEHELSERLQTARVRLYKFFKLTVRANADTSSATYRLFGTELRQYAWTDRSDSLAPRQAAQRPGVMDYISLYRLYRQASPIIDTCHEDGLPPFLPAVLALRAGQRTGPAYHPEFEAVEHVVLSMAVLKTPQLGGDVSVYEASQPVAARIPNSEIGSLAQLFQGFIFQREGLHYLSEAKLLDNLKRIDAAGPQGLPLVNEFLFENKVSPERTVAGYRAMHHMLLAIAHKEMDEKDAVTNDLEHFGKEAAAAGLPAALVQSMANLLDDPAAAKRDASLFLLARFAKLAASRLGGASAAESVQQALAPIQGAMQNSEELLSKETVRKGATSVKEKGSALWEKAKNAVQ